MSSHFPIFVDVHTVPPLVIGDSDVLTSKIRLLLKIAPVIDIVTTAASTILPEASADQLHICDAVTPHDDAVLSMLAGRPLVIIETGDPARNKMLATHAKSLGVPVNVPDTISLCSFFLGSIVDRSPVIVAISTSGLAPVLAQHIRARIEDMLAPATGKLAHYLFRLRDRIKHLPHAMRRGLQHQILNGQIASYILAGKETVADNATMHMLGNSSSSQKQAHAVRASVHIVDAGAGAKGLLSLDAAEAIRHADSIFYDHLVSDEVLDLARREATLTFCQLGQHKGDMSIASFISKLEAASETSDRVIYLVGGDPRQTQTADF
ncbi:MAG: NAD(P)-dependent oxidoreductase, partial [Candidatus Puniceispirillum sp.]